VDGSSTHSPAVPGVHPGVAPGVDEALYTLDVDGQVFALRPAEFGGTAYTWLSGPNPGYGFGVSPTPSWTVEQHRAIIRDFLARIDPATGYLGDD
jgi:hypothetical protein